MAAFWAGKRHGQVGGQRERIECAAVAVESTGAIDSDGDGVRFDRLSNAVTG